MPTLRSRVPQDDVVAASRRLRGRKPRRLLLVLIGCLTTASGFAQGAGRSPLHGALPAGPHAVGFTRLQLADPTRPRPNVDEQEPGPSDRARRITVHVWYPGAAGSTNPTMTFAEAMVAHLHGRPAEELARRESAVRTFLAQFGPIADDDWRRLKGMPLLARENAAAAAGRFPLVIGALRPLSTTVTSEFLASHGYVVAMVDGEEGIEPQDSGAALEVDYRDMEFAIPELRKQPYVHPSMLAALGFSGSGFSQLLLAMRHPDVRAVCDLESAIFDDRILHPLSRGWGYSVTALRVPFLHTYSVPLSKRENRIGDFERMRYSTRYRYLVDAPGIHHWDFATEGMAASVLGVRGANGPRLQQAFETTNRYLLQFFDAYVKGDREAVEFLRRDPEANGVPGGLVTIREHTAIAPAPTPDEIARTVESRGPASALDAIVRARATDPEADLFREPVLNRVAYRVLRTRAPADSIPFFRTIVEWYPASSNAYDSLAEALEAAGETQQAIAATERGLQVLAKQELTPEQRRDMAAILEARLRRLK
jgi:hypothetical protein